jgi:hypothetical protein
VKPTDRLKLIAGVRDLQIVDANRINCGIVDDIEFEGKPGGPLRLAAIMVGPGAWARRLPRWVSPLAGRIAGRRCIRIPWGEVKSITSVVRLHRTAAELGLAAPEAKAARLLPGIGGLDASG